MARNNKTLQEQAGDGLLLSEKAAAEKAAATQWKLSRREWDIVHSLGGENG